MTNATCFPAPANNAFLKTLEEPPKHVRFILATTELHKIIPTILSRCQRFQFRRIPAPVIANHLKGIITQRENTEIADPAELDRILYHIARASEGGLRDALVSLDQLLAFCSGALRLDRVEEALGIIEYDRIERFILAIARDNLEEILQVIEEICGQGREMGWLLKECLQFMRNLAVLKISSKLESLVELPDEYRAQLLKAAEEISLEQVLYITDQFWEAERRLRFTSESRLVMEMTALKAAKAGQAVKVPDLLKRLSSLPAQAASPASPAPPAPYIPPTPATDIPPPVETPLLEETSIPAIPQPSDNPPSTAPQTSAESLEETPSLPSTVDQMSSAWNRILHQIEESNPMIAAALHDSVAEMKGNTLLVALPAQNESYLRTLRLDRNRRSLKKLVKENFGTSLRIRYEIRDDLVTSLDDTEEASNPAPAPLTQPSRKELREKVESNEQFKKLMEEIPGRIVGIIPEAEPKENA